MRSIALAACLILAAVMAWFGARPPKPAGLDAPAAEFSAARAMTDVRAIAARPHPVGSAANQAVRDQLVRRLAELGATVEIQSAETFDAEPLPDGSLTINGGKVENIVAVFPGSKPELPAVGLMAHYDSVAGSPGAADDAAGVAAILETARALKAKGPHARDVIVILTDGEEAGLLGARAFFGEHALAKRLGFVVNLEARGGGGRAMMFETGPQNAETVALFAKAAPRPLANSLTAFVYGLMPNDTDFSLPRDAGVAGVNFAFMGRQFDYHAASSTPQALDQGSLQDIGRQALAVAVHAADAAVLPAKRAQAAYAQAAGPVLVRYPAWLGWGLLAASAALIWAAVRRARERTPVRLVEALRGAGAGLYVGLAGAALLRLARRATGAGFDPLGQRPLLAHAEAFEAAVMLIALGVVLYAAAAMARQRARWPAAAVALGAGAASSLFGGLDLVGLGLGVAGAAVGAAAFGRPAALSSAWAGVLGLGLAAGVIVQALAPPAAFIVAWPLLLASLTAALVALAAVRDEIDTGVAAVAGALGLGWLIGFAHMAHIALDRPEILAPFAVIAALMLWPLAQPRGGGAGRFTALGVFTAALALVLWVRFQEPWSDRNPRLTGVAYVVDQDAGTAWRADVAEDGSPWTRRALGAGAVRRAFPPLLPRPVQAAPADLVAVRAPALELSATVEGSRLLQAMPPPGAGLFALDLTATADIASLEVEGRKVAAHVPAGKPIRLRWHGDPDGVAIAFPSPAGGGLTVRYAVVVDAWPAAAAALPARPRDAMASGLSGSTVAVGSKSLAW